MDDSANFNRRGTISRGSAPHFYVVDSTAAIHFASKPAAEAPPSGVLTLMLRAAIGANQAGAASSPLVFAGTSIRSERLATPGDDDRFVVFLESARATPRDVSVTVAGDVDLSAEPD